MHVARIFLWLGDAAVDERVLAARGLEPIDSRQRQQQTRESNTTNGIQSVPAAWHPDPSGRHQYRFWDGHRWTDWIANDGVRGKDPLIQPDAPFMAVEKVAAGEPVKRHKASQPQRETRSQYLLLGATGYPNTEVAGEFARMDSIHKAIGPKPKREEEIERADLIASVVPEPTNPHDTNAVMVQINGQHVGYLEKEVAARYVSVIRDVWNSGHVATTGARIWASARESWDSSRKLKYVARVSIALNEPHLVLPMNEPPGGRTASCLGVPLSSSRGKNSTRTFFPSTSLTSAMESPWGHWHHP